MKKARLFVFAILIGFSLVLIGVRGIKYFKGLPEQLVSRQDTMQVAIEYRDSLWGLHKAPGVYLIRGVGHYDGKRFDYDTIRQSIMYRVKANSPTGNRFLVPMAAKYDSTSKAIIYIDVLRLINLDSNKITYPPLKTR